MSTLERPNVVIVLADDLGWGDLGCYGATRIGTPNIDRLASEGVRFEDVHSASSVCTPSRYALLTGRYCWRSPLKRRVLMGHAPALIERARPTIASVLQSAGYATAAIGKWHLGLGWRQKDGSVWSALESGDPLELQDVGIDFERGKDRGLDDGSTIDYAQPFINGPLDLGFERFFGIAGSLDMPPYAFLSQDRTVGIPDREKEVYLDEQRAGLQTEDWDERQVDLRFTSEAVKFIEERAGSMQPFFLYFATSAPHRPQVPPSFLVGSSEAGPRGDSVVFVDWMTQQLLDALDRAGKTENTLFIFTSDNGAPTIFDDGDTTIHRPNGPWRGQKGDIWEGGHREPFIVRWPGRIPAGAIRQDSFGLIDLLPSLASIVGLERPADAAPDAVDVSALLVGAQGAGHGSLVHHSMGGAFSVRSGKWKAIFSTGSGGGFSDPKGEVIGPSQPEGQLYDLSVDPWERRNVWAQNPDLVADLYTELMAIAGDPGSGLSFDAPIAGDRHGSRSDPDSAGHEAT